MTTKLLIIIGPTAVGKSALGIELAQRFHGEIISGDSRQIYRHMSIGTAKPSAEELATVPHHLINIMSPDESYSLVLFLRQVRELILTVKKEHDRLPIVVGGTGQYIWGLVEGWQVPEVQPDLTFRAKLERQANGGRAEELYQDLLSADPKAAERIDPRNTRRVIRALEVWHSRPQGTVSNPRKIAPDYDVMIIGLTMERKALYKRIDDRVDAMIEAGWIDEVRNLLDCGYSPDLPALSSLGYSEIIQHLDNKLSLDEAVQRIKYRTHRFARQQYTWFHLQDPRIRWFDVASQYHQIDPAVAEWLRS